MHRSCTYMEITKSNPLACQPCLISANGLALLPPSLACGLALLPPQHANAELY